jgi:hypothetical protein
MTETQQRYAVHARHEGRPAGHVVEGASPEAAAVAYLEAWGGEAGPEGEVMLVVQALDDGCEHCIRVDLETGETAPCAG